MLILKQNSANSVPTPPAGKGTIFLDDSDTLSVKTSDGNVETFPTVAAANTQVVFIDGTSLSGNANFTYNKNTDTLSLTGTVSAGNIKTNNLLYANGSPWDLQQPGGSNTQIQYNDEDQFGGSAAFTFNKSSNLVSMGGALGVTGNANVGNIGGGAGVFTANVTAANIYANSGTIGAQTLKGEGGNISNIAAGNINGQVANALVAGTVYTAAQPNITSVGTLSTLSVSGNANVGNLGTAGLITATGNVTGGNLVTTGSANVGELNASGNAVITGNLTVNGNVTYVNVDTLEVEDPIISMGGGPNGAALTSNDGKDRGTLLHYYTTSAIDAFMGWDNSNGEFAFGSNVGIVNDVITFNTLGNVRVGNIIGNGQALTGITGANVTGQVANALVAGTVYTAAQPNITSVGTLTSLGVSGNLTAPNVIANTGAFYGNAAGLTNIPGANITGAITGNISNANYASFAGQVVDSTQSNITSVGKLTSLLAGSDATAANFANATVIAAAGDSGATDSSKAGLVGEALASGVDAVGLFGVAKANGTYKGTGVQGTATVNASADTGSAVGVRGISATTHSGGYNIGVLGNAAGSGVGNYAFYVQAGDIASIEANTVWDLYDNSTTALSLNSSGKAGILAISTADSAEGVTMSGTLSVTGNATVGGIKTDNFYYANGSPVDFQQTGGTNTDIQFNDSGNFGGSNAFTFNKTSNVVTISGNLSVANVQATGALIGATLTSNGNANVGNLGTAGLITATGNVSGGNLTTTGVVSATGNVSGGNLTTTGALSVTGNANVGNIGVTHVVVTGNVTGNLLPSANVTYDLGSDTQRWRDLYLAGNTITLGSQTINSNSTSTQLSGVLNANGAGLYSLNASNLASGTVPTARMSGNYTINVIGWANTVADNAQPNITSLGTLTSVAVTGNVTAGNVYANSGTIGASLLTGTLTTAAQPNVTSVGSLTGLTMAANADITLSGTNGDISGANNVSATTLTGTLTTAAQPNVTSVGTLTSLAVTGNGTFGNVYANSGTIGASLLTGTLTTAAQPNVTSVGTLTSLAVTGNVTAGNVYANSGTIGASLIAGTLTTAAQPNITSVGTLSSLTVTGNVVGGNLNTAGKVVASTLESNVATGTAPFTVASTTKVANLNADLLDGYSTDTAATANTVVIRDTNGSFSANVVTANLSGNATTAGTVVTAAQPNITSVGTLTSLAVTGNATAGNVYANTGTIGASLLTGTLTTAAQPNITSVGTLSSVTVTGNVAAGNLTTTGVLSVTGTGVSSIAGNLDMTSNNIINLATPVNDSDAATKAYVDSVAQGLHVHDSCYVATTGTLNTASGGTVSYNNGSSGVGATLTTTGTFNLIDGGNVQTVGTRILVKNEANAVWNGVYTYTNTTTLTRATDYDTTAEAAGGDFLFVTSGTTQADTGWVQTTDNPTIGTSNIVFTQFAGAGTYTAGTGLTLTGTVFSVNASQTQVTALGTVTTGTWNSLVGSSATFAAGLSGANLASITGANVTGQVANALVSGTVYTAAQPNITSVGTLTSVAITGNATAGNVYANSGTIGASLLTGTLTTAAQPNITSVGTLTSVAITGNATAGNVYANSGTVGASLLTGTLTTAAQPNVTSVGTLTSLTVTGTTTSGNFATAGNLTASFLVSNVATGTAPLTVTSTTRVANLNVAYANVADNINVSDVSTGTYYPVLANAATGNVSEGSNSALTFNAATGTLSSTTFSGAHLGAHNGTVGATTPNTGAFTTISASGQITSTVTTGTAPFVVSSTTKVANLNADTLDGYDTSVTATANTIAVRDANGNLFANNITGTLATSTQAGITQVGTLSNLNVSGNITAVNITANTGVFTGNGSAISAINASNISSGTLAQARLANSSLTVNGTAISLGGSGTITANATQALTLGSYLTGTSYNGGTAVTATVDATSANTASKVVARDASGNFSAGTITATLSGAATTAGTVTTAAQPNITSVGTLTSLTVSGNITASTNYFVASTNAAVSAAGTVQGNATVIASQVNVVSTVASGAGVALPTAVAGVRVTLINTAANALLVYPATGGQINALGTNASYSLAAGGRLDFQATSATQWYTMGAAYG